jgi:anti-sigma B factor antagonist
LLGARLRGTLEEHGPEVAVDIDVRKHGRVHVVRLKGQLKLGEPVDELRATIDGIMNEGDFLIVANLAEVPMADSSGIGALVRYQTSLKTRGGALKLVTPSKLVTQTLKILGLLNVFEVFNQEQEAIDSFGTGAAAGTQPS